MSLKTWGTVTESQDQVDVSLGRWKFACSVLLPCFLVFVGSSPWRRLAVAQRWSWRCGLWEAGRAAERLFKSTGPSRHSVHSVCNKVSFWSLLLRAFPHLLDSVSLFSAFQQAGSWIYYPNYPGSLQTDFYPLFCLFMLASQDEVAGWSQDLTVSWY